MAWVIWIPSPFALTYCSKQHWRAEAKTSLQATFCFASTLQGGETRLNFTHGIPADTCKLTPLHSRRCSPMCVESPVSLDKDIGGQHIASVIWVWNFLGIWKAVLLRKCISFFFFLIIYAITEFTFPSAHSSACLCHALLPFTICLQFPQPFHQKSFYSSKQSFFNQRKPLGLDFVCVR